MPSVLENPIGGLGADWVMGRGEGEAVEVDWDRRGVSFADADDLVHGELAICRRRATMRSEADGWAREAAG